MTSDPTLRPEKLPEDLDRALRPQMLEEFVGQAEARANLAVFIQSARMRGESMDHTLFHGPPGLGKTTLAQIMARELGVGFRMTSGPVLAKPGDLAAILTNLEPRDVLFIDEIHRLSAVVEEVLYPAMEDFALDLVIGEGPAARTVRIDLQPFTLVGATTRLGLLTTPLRDRFGIPTRLQFYTEDELDHIVTRGARLLGIESDPAGTREIARRARGTPRIAGRLLRRVVDFVTVEGNGRIDNNRYAPQPVAVYDSRRRNNERLFEAPVTSVRAVLATSGQRCWVEREQVQGQGGNANVPGALAGALIGGILGHQVGGGSGKDIATVGGVIAGAALGAQVGRDGQAATQDVRRCENTPGGAQPAFWDVSYSFRGQDHRVQMAMDPGNTITVNERGEPRQQQ